MYRIVLWSIIGLLGAATVYLYARGDYFRANVSLVSLAGILLPGFLYSHISWLRDRFSVSAMRAVEMTTAVSIMLNSAGALGLYYVGLEYDGVLHFAVTAMMAFLVMAITGVVLQRRKSKHYVGKSIFIGVVAVTLVSVIGWESFEHYGDKAWGTNLSTDPAQPTLDTWVDIIWDSVGLFVAALFGRYTLEHFIRMFRSEDRS